MRTPAAPRKRNCENGVDVWLVGDTTVGDTTVGEMTVGDTTVGETAVGEATVGDPAVGDAEVAPGPAGAPDPPDHAIAPTVAVRPGATTSFTPVEKVTVSGVLVTLAAT